MESIIQRMAAKEADARNVPDGGDHDTEELEHLRDLRDLVEEFLSEHELQSNDLRHTFDLGNNQSIEVVITSEGVIVDCFARDEHVGTRAELARDLFDTFIERNGLRTCDECGRVTDAGEAPDWVNGVCEHCDPTLLDGQMEVDVTAPTVDDLMTIANTLGEVNHLSASIFKDGEMLCGQVLFLGRDTLICTERWGTEHGHQAEDVPHIKTRQVLPAKELKTYRIGNVYEFQAEDSWHAVQQYENLMGGAGSGETNYVEEVKR